MAENKKSKKVLVASAILAAMIVASSSFAWFTSKDEVVNRLTADNKYAVTVTEDFTPPSNWIPGQVVKKEAGAINTGNIDAFVRLTLSNEMSLTTYGTPEAFNADNTDNYINLSIRERQSLQAGGRLVCKAGTTVDEKVDDTFNAGDFGLYIFERVSAYNDDGSVKTKTYSGYYFRGGYYYSLANITHNDENNTFSATVQTKKTEKITSPALNLTYDDANSKLVATYGNGDENITINIALDEDNISNWTNKEGTNEFYYNSILAAGRETGNLVKSVEIDKSVENTAYISMDYSLKVTAESVQATQDDAKTTAVNESAWGMTANVTDTATGAVTWTPKV